ncbi:MAG: hypothetical protein IH588_14730 [Anaerolineales bacterium]|nr:hypothetical protein [Anaerolineales bacterium]
MENPVDKPTRFDLMIDTFVQLAQEEQTHQTPPAPGLPTLRSVLADLSPLPQEALFLGLAEDGLPVLLNLHDPIPGPLLITGDQASGKTRFLQTIARATDYLHNPDNVQYSIITSHPKEWKFFQGNQNNVGIYSTYEGNAEKLINSLVAWAHNNRGEQQFILLLIDDIESVIKLNQQVEQNLRWLLMRGPSRRVWPIVTLNATRALHLKEWMSFFHTRLFGRVESPDESNFITANPSHTLTNLIAGSQFALREDDELLNFWVPTLD